MVISGGIIVAEGTPGTLGGRERAAAQIRFSLPLGTTADDLPEPVRASLIGHDGERVLLRASSPIAVLGPLLIWAEGCGCDLTDLEVRRPSLEDIYLALTSPEAEGG
jgi:ABC-2 type transport system ATP-binding protein